MLSIKENHLKDESVIKLGGVLDLESTAELKGILNGCLARGQKSVRIDMEMVELISSSGVGALMNFQQEINKVEGRLVLEKLSQQCLYVLNLLRLTDFFTIK